MDSKPIIKILVVDDHEIMRGEIEDLLKNESGFELCPGASNFAMAMEHIEKYQPDICLIDLALRSGPSGTDLINEVSRNRSKPRCIAMSARSEEELSLYCQENGIPQYIPKLELVEKLIPLLRSV